MELKYGPVGAGRSNGVLPGMGPGFWRRRQALSGSASIAARPPAVPQAVRPIVLAGKGISMTDMPSGCGRHGGPKPDCWNGVKTRRPRRFRPGAALQVGGSVMKDRTGPEHVAAGSGHGSKGRAGSGGMAVRRVRKLRAGLKSAPETAAFRDPAGRPCRGRPEAAGRACRPPGHKTRGQADTGPPRKAERGHSPGIFGGQCAAGWNAGASENNLKTNAWRAAPPRYGDVVISKKQMPHWTLPDAWRMHSGQARSSGFAVRRLPTMARKFRRGLQPAA